MNRLAGSTVLVTGASSGIGRALSEMLIEQGASVLGVSRHPATLPAGVAPIAADLTKREDIQEIFQNLGKIDALVNCAGITGPNSKLADYPVDAWRQVIEVNLNGVFLCCREWVPHLRERPWARIVNIASVAGKEGNPNASAYSASKAGVIALTKSLGKELADTGVRVNCVTPAAVKTAIFDQMTPEHIAFMLSKIPMGRFGTAAEIASMVAWLCTEDCAFSTGATFDLSGGRATY